MMVKSHRLDTTSTPTERDPLFGLLLGAVGAAVIISAGELLVFLRWVSPLDLVGWKAFLVPPMASAGALLSTPFITRKGCCPYCAQELKVGPWEQGFWGKDFKCHACERRVVYRDHRLYQTPAS